MAASKACNQNLLRPEQGTTAGKKLLTLAGRRDRMMVLADDSEMCTAFGRRERTTAEDATEREREKVVAIAVRDDKEAKEQRRVRIEQIE